MKQLTGRDVEQILINPFYAVTIHADLATPHKPIVSKAEWIEANLRLIDQIGTEAWLQKLLAVLEGDFPRHPDNGGRSSFGYEASDN